MLEYQGTTGFSVLLSMEKNYFFPKHQSYYAPNLKESKEDSYLPAKLVDDNKFSRTCKPCQLAQKKYSGKIKIGSLLRKKVVSSLQRKRTCVLTFASQNPREEVNWQMEIQNLNS